MSFVFADTTKSCTEPLGMEDKRIADDQITASSEWSSNIYHGANNARLNRASHGETTGAWSVQTNDLNQWIEVDLMVPTWITGVMIQGREDSSQWVTEYKVEHSSDGQNWTYVQSNDDQEGMVSGCVGLFTSTGCVRKNYTIFNF